MRSTSSLSGPGGGDDSCAIQLNALAMKATTKVGELGGGRVARGGWGRTGRLGDRRGRSLAGRAILSVLLMTGVVVAVVTTTSLAEGWTKLLDSGGGSGSPSRSINPKGRAGTIIAGWRFYWLAGGNSGYLGDLPRLTL